jgi:hypothetical protein
MRDYLLREEVEQLLREGVRWRIAFCAGGEQKGVGLAEFPSVILDKVPNPAQHRKLQSGGSGGRRTYAFAQLTEAAGERLLAIDEG